MPNYTTSYSTNKKPRCRTSAPAHLPGGRRRIQRKPGAQYLHHTQGFGRRGRRGTFGGGRRDPRGSYALIIVGCAALLFLASVIWYANRGVDIELNGEKTSVRIHSTIDRVIKDEKLAPKPGNLLAVDDTVLKKGGGPACTVKLDGKDVKLSKLDSTELSGGEKLSITDGADVYEKHEVEATDIKPTLTIEGSGAIQYVATWGKMGRSEIWTGLESGKTADKGVVVKPVDCVVERTSVIPSDRSKKLVALTFDEAPSKRTQEIVRILEEKKAEATFFLAGDKAEGNTAAVKAIKNAGFEIGANAYADKALDKMPAEELRDELTQGFKAVKKAGGGQTALLRPPFGEFSDQNWADAMDLVSTVVSWNVDSGDWLLKGAQQVVDTVVGSARTGNIILLTDNDEVSDQTIEALPKLIDALRNDGFEIVSLGDLIKSDKDLAKAVSLSKVTMPKDAVLPELPDDEAEQQMS